MITTSKIVDMASLALRFVFAIVLFPHGAQLLFGWFVGPGYTNAMQYFTTVVGLPYIVGVGVIIMQFMGAILFMLGFASRFLAVLFILMFVGMVFSGHIEHGFFMNWFGTQKGEGFEYHLLAMGILFGVLILGGGRWSLDAVLIKHKPIVLE